MNAEVVVHLLGGQRVLVGSEARTLSAARERALLARLALTNGAVVATADLVDELWPDDPPASARNTLQTYVSHIRRVVAPATVEFVGHGYRLVGATTDLAELDHQLNELAHLPDVLRRDSLRSLLVGWPDDPLADAGEGAFVVAARRHWHERRRTTEDELIELRLGAGEQDHLVAELATRCAHDPHRERSAMQLALALYRCGRGAEALDALQRLRLSLREDLGLQPGPEVQLLEHRLLTHDPTLSLAAASPDPRLPMPSALALSGAADRDLVGRRAELARLRRALDDVCDGAASPAIWVDGDAGIGKSRLARELAVEAYARAATVLWGRCTPEDVGGFVSIVEAIDPLARHRPDAVVDPNVLAALLPALRSGRPDALALLRAEANQPALVVNALCATLSQAAAGGPVVLVIDDLQWADGGSLNVLDRLIDRQVRGLLIVVTVRTPEPTRNPAIPRLRARLERSGAAEVMELRGLRAAEVRALMDGALGDASADAAVHDMVQLTGGNPFYVTSVLAELGRGAARSDAVQLPNSVRSLLAERLDRLDPSARAVLAAAALCGPIIDVATCASAADRPVVATVAALEQALALHLIIESSAPGSFAFPHGLVRAAALERVSEAHRQMVEERLLRRQSQRGGSGEVGRRVVGRRLMMVSDDSSLSRIDRSLMSSRMLIDRIASTDTEGPVPRAPGAVEVSRATAGRSMLRLARTLAHRGQRVHAVVRAGECVALAQRLGDAVLLAESALELADLARRVAGPPGHAPAEVDAAVAAALTTVHDADDATMQRLLVHAAVGAASVDHARARSLARTAEMLARRQGDELWVAEALLALRLTHFGAGEGHERLHLASTAVRFAPADSDAAARALSAMVFDLVDVDRIADARALAEENGLIGSEGDHLVTATLGLLRGDLDLAVAATDRAARSEGAVDAMSPDDPIATLLLSVSLHSNSLADSVSSLEAAARRWPNSLLWRASYALALRAAGDAEACGQEVQSIASDDVETLDRLPTAPAGRSLLARLRPDRQPNPTGTAAVVAGWAGVV